MINLTSVELSEKMVKTSAELPPEIDEFEIAGLEKTKSTDVKPSRLKDAKVALKANCIDIWKLETALGICYW